MKQILITVAGAVLGGILGYNAFFWVVDQGFYGLVIPGGLLGIGAGFGRSKSIWVPVACAVAAVALGVYTEWKFRPFVKDDSLGYFLQHIFDLRPITLLMIALGGALGFWMPFRRTEERK
jgi:hypothetical protein